MQLAGADQARRPARDPFLFTKAGGMTQTVTHPGFPEEEIPCEEADVLDLEAEGFIRSRPSDRGLIFDLTPAGLRRAAELNQAYRASAGGPVDQHLLDWSSRVLPVLNAHAQAYSRARSTLGASTDAVLEELGPNADPDTVALTLAELVRTGYLEETLGSDQSPGPISSRPTEKGLQVTAGWPTDSGEVALERLLAVIEQQIEGATSEEERSKWKRLRDGVAGVGRDVFVNALTTAVNAAVKDVAS
jgi:DNA-binding MarR family transcriptional regulator